jgi:hypothetical protein
MTLSLHDSQPSGELRVPRPDVSSDAFWRRGRRPAPATLARRSRTVRCGTGCKIHRIGCRYPGSLAPEVTDYFPGTNLYGSIARTSDSVTTSIIGSRWHRSKPRAKWNFQASSEMGGRRFRKDRWRQPNEFGSSPAVRERGIGCTALSCQDDGRRASRATRHEVRYPLAKKVCAAIGRWLDSYGEPRTLDPGVAQMAKSAMRGRASSVTVGNSRRILLTAVYNAPVMCGPERHHCSVSGPNPNRPSSLPCRLPIAFIAIRSRCEGTCEEFFGNLSA